MELEDMYGDIGIKCPIRQVMEDEDGNEILLNDGVEVVPSREAVRWTPATRDFLKKQFKQAQVEASEIVEKELQETDLVKWLKACKGIKSGVGGSIVSRLSRIVDLDSLTPKFNGTSIQYSHISQFFNAFNVSYGEKVKDREGFKINQNPNVSWSNFNGTILLKKESFSRVKSLYVHDSIQNNFLTISLKTETAIELMAPAKLSNDRKDAWVKSKLKEQDTIIKLLEASTETMSYDDIDVPQSYIDSLKVIEEKVLEDDIKSELSHDERRALEEKVVCSTYTDRYVAYRDENEITETYQRNKREMKFKEVKEYHGSLFYGYKEDNSKLQFAAHILDHHNYIRFTSWTDQRFNKFFNDEYKILSIAKNNKKHFKDHSHIDDFFGKETQLIENDKVIGTKIDMDNAIVHWNTARKMAPFMDQLVFLSGFKDIDEDVHRDYLTVTKYMKRYHSDLTTYSNRFGMNDHYNDFISFIEKIEKIQDYSESGDSEGLTEFLKESKLSSNIKSGLAVNKEILTILESLMNYSKPVATLFNNIPKLTMANELDMDLTMYISDIVAWKKLKYNTND